LRHLYGTYPPKNPEHKLDNKDLGNRDKMKKTLLRALLHYHPDKQDKEQHGKKWVVLCEEVTKLLNGRYESYKFPPSEQTANAGDLDEDDMDDDDNIDDDNEDDDDDSDDSDDDNDDDDDNDIDDGDFMDDVDDGDYGDFMDV